MEEIILADLKVKRNQLMEELASVDRNIARTEASLDRTSISLNNGIDLVDSHEQHELVCRLFKQSTFSWTLCNFLFYSKGDV